MFVNYSYSIGGIEVLISSICRFIDRELFNITLCSFSSDNLIDDIIYLVYLRNHTKLRVTHVVTGNTTDERIENYLMFQNKYNIQFTIKELFGHDDKGRYKAIRKKYPDIYHLDTGDYNIYYMPNNSIKDKFLPDIVK